MDLWSQSLRNIGWMASPLSLVAMTFHGAACLFTSERHPSLRTKCIVEQQLILFFTLTSCFALLNVVLHVLFKFVMSFGCADSCLQCYNASSHRANGAKLPAVWVPRAPRVDTRSDRTLLGAPGIATRSKCLTTRNKKLVETIRTYRN